MSNRVPLVGGDSGTPNWGTILNNFLSVAMVPGEATGTAPSATASSHAGSLTYVSIQTTTYSIGSSTTVTAGNETVLANASGGAFTVTLPSASTQPSAIHSVKKTDSSTNAVTIASSSGTIDGGTTAVIHIQYLSLTFASDGTNWNVI